MAGQEGMINETISPEKARRFYDRLGSRYDWADFYEGAAKEAGLAELALEPGLRVLHAGCGTGKDQAWLQAAAAPGLVVALDLSAVMLGLTHQRTGSPACQASVLHLPLTARSFDRIFAAYLLDLINYRDLPQVLAEFHRVLAPGGRLALVSLTEGCTPASRALVGLWKAIYAVAPVACGGCRPLQLAGLVEAAGFQAVRSRVLVQFGVPSEVLAAVATG